jgi:hypothetical protein
LLSTTITGYQNHRIASHFKNPFHSSLMTFASKSRSAVWRDP